MSRKQKIIVSITGIILVSLILIGLTYAYFLTKITGNTNDKSISVTTANLILEYGENTSTIQGINNAEPGYSVEKIFTATNKGNSSVTYGAALEDIVNSLSRQQDLVYTLTCTSYLKNGFNLSSNGTITGTVDGTCNGVTTEKQFPSTSTLSITTTNTIDTTHTHAYKLTVTYKEMGVDQSTDMGKTFSAKVNIVDLAKFAVDNPYRNDTGTLKKAIIDNAMLSLNGTEYRETPLTQPAVEITSVAYSKGTDPTTYSSTLTNATNYYIIYADDYKVDETTGSITLINTNGAIKYTTDMATNLAGKYAIWATSLAEVNWNTQFPVEIYKITPNVSDITSSIKYATINSSSLKIISTEKELSIAPDDYGTSYYYRGGVEDNYANFAGMCWRIVRIEGAGSVKLILEDYNTTCESSEYTGNWSDDNTYVFGYDSDYNADFLNNVQGIEDGSIGLSEALEDFQTSKLSEYLDKLKVDNWCYDYNVGSTGDDGIKFYGAYSRIYNGESPLLKCTGTKLNKFKDETDMYVGTLTADEIFFAGAADSTNYNYYLMNDYVKNNYLSFWTISPGFIRTDDNDYTLYLTVDGSIEAERVNDGSFFARASVTLLPNTQITSGDGTKDKPYVVE